MGAPREGTLTIKETKLVEALAAPDCQTVVGASRRAGISEAGTHLALQRPRVQQALEKQREINRKRAKTLMEQSESIIAKSLHRFHKLEQRENGKHPLSFQEEGAVIKLGLDAATSVIKLHESLSSQDREGIARNIVLRSYLKQSSRLVKAMTRAVQLGPEWTARQLHRLKLRQEAWQAELEQGRVP